MKGPKTQLEVVIPAASFRSGTVKRITRLLLTLLEKILGETLYVLIPDALTDVPHNSEHHEALVFAQKLQTHGWCKSILRNSRLPDEPFLYSYSAIPHEPNAPGGWGADFNDETAALKRTLSEFTERFIWFTKKVPEAQTRSATVAEIGRSIAFPLENLAGFSDKQKKELPFLKHDADTHFTWLQVTSLLSPRKTAWCPLQLISGAHFRDVCVTQPKEKLLRHSSTNGLATSWHSREDAILSGLLEVIERDAFTRCWNNEETPKKVPLSVCEDSMKEMERFHLEPILLSLPTEFPVHIVAAVLLDRTGEGPAVSLGMKAACSIHDAAEGALREAASLRHELRLNDRWKKKVPPLEKCVSSDDRIAFWSQQEHVKHLDFFISSNETAAGEDTAPLSIPEQLAQLTHALREKNCHPYVHEFSHPFDKDVHTVMTIVPELMPLQTEGDVPYLGIKNSNALPHPLA